jgi:hypothetical protein
VAAGTRVSIQAAATSMISISDNTAADLLFGLVGRDAVQAQARRWTAADHPGDDPFLTTKEMFKLHYDKGLAGRYLATPPGRRRAFLATSVDPLPISVIASGYSDQPRYIDQLEWFASPADICRALGGLQVLSTEPGLAPLSTVLSRAVFGIKLDRSKWPTVWFKGGSESGVLTLGWLARDSIGKTFVVEAMVSNPHAPLSEASMTELVSLAEQAFGELGSSS